MMPWLERIGGLARAARWRGLLRFLPLVAASSFLARAATSAIRAKLGHPGATLDDSYIHFQYARAIAEGHPFQFHAGEAATSGTTSLLWPALLAPFYAAGLREERILWAAWGLAFTAMALLAYEAFALAKRLAGRAAALGAGALVLAFGGFLWCAASGMEVVPFAWAIARVARRASEWAEAPPEDRTRGRAYELVALAWIAALFRPEGGMFALFAAAVLVARPGSERLRDRIFGLAAAAAPAATPLLLWAVTGQPSSTTMVAKLLPGNPYYTGPALTAAVLGNVRLLVGTLLEGEIWSAEFIPHGGAWVAMAGLAAVVFSGWRTRSWWSVAAVLLLALAMFAPCFYLTFLWNRLRYLWPFATGWLVGLACLTRVVGDLAGLVRPRWRVVGPLVCGVFAGMFASKLEWVIDDIAQSASGIDRQQVALGHWAKRHLPPDARIGVNDTGAIAYFGGHPTFDIVGLTTAGEARYWVAGPGSRFEHYERLYASRPHVLPTHFIVYPEWMACDAVLGEPLHQATVTDATILGGQTMRVYRADYELLGSGELPWTAVSSPLLDALDVADLESEAEHGYELLGARDGEQVARRGLTPEGRTIADGGRAARARERFVARLPPGKATRAIVRLESAEPTRVVVLASGAEVGALDVPAGPWGELELRIPPELVRAETPIDVVVTGPRATFFHYWFFDDA